MPGAAPTPYERAVLVYIPAQYRPGTSTPFIVIHDGASAKNRAIVPPILDNLIYEKRIPAIVAVMVHHGGGDGPGSERGLEYDTVSDRYTMFIEQEVLPRIARDYNVTFRRSKDSDHGRLRRGSGILIAWFHPGSTARAELLRNFVNQENRAIPRSLAAPGNIMRLWFQTPAEADSDLDACRRNGQWLHRDEASLLAG